MVRRAKIVCTIGPKTQEKKALKSLCDNGMNVARLNFSHGTHKSHKDVIDSLKEIRKEYSHPIGILQDTKGPEIRVGEIQDIEVVPKERVRLVSADANEAEIPVNPGFIVTDIKVGMQILIDDGYVRGYIVDKGKDKGRSWADVEIENHGVIKRGKGINVPSQLFDLPDMTEQDLSDIEFGCKEGVDFIAASFVNTAEQLLAIKEHIRKCGGQKIMLIAKIESKQGVKNFDDILQIADGIMIARGDLGVELFVGDVPPLQKKMIRQCNLNAKPVIVATQMLESMMQSQMPTRAEASDVANAVYDSGSALMLSGETAVGDYPDTAVRMMHQIIIAAENDFDHRAHFQKIGEVNFHDIPSALARAAVNTGFHVGASAIIVCSNSGNTIRQITRYRPKAKIIAVTPSEQTFFQTSLMWGTECYREKCSAIENDLHQISAYALQRDWVKYGDPMVVTLGKPYGVSHTTNTITVESVGKVIVRGQPMELDDIVPITAPIAFFLSIDSTKCQDFSGKVVVITRFEEKFIKRLKCASAIVLQNNLYDVVSEENLEAFSAKTKIPYIVQADGATTLLKEDLLVRIYPSLGFICPADSPTEEQMLSFSI